MAQRDDRLPLTYRLPDGDVAQAITWAFVVDQIRDFMNEMTRSMTAINGDLLRIEAKIDSWIEDNG